MANEFIARRGLIVPSGSNIWVVSGSVTASQFIGTASAAISSSYSLTASAVPNAIITASAAGSTITFTKGNGETFQTTIATTTAESASYVEYSNVANKPTLVSASSQIDVRNTTGIATLATTGSNTFIGNQIISGSLITTTDTITFNGAMAVSGGIAVTGSIDIISGSVIGTSSWANKALTASYAESGTGFPFSGSAVITGSLLVIATGSVGGITGSFSGSGVGLTDLRASIGVDSYYFIGDGVADEYILSQSYTPNSIFVSVEGINYAYGNDFTLNGPTMSFVTTPPSESNVVVKAFLAVSSGSYINYTGSFIGDGYGLDNLRGSLAIETNKFVGDGTTTNYTLSSSYAPQSMLVTVGGLRYIDTNDYTVTGNVIQFTQAPASQSIIVAQAYLIISSGSVGTFSGSFIGNASTATSASFATTASFASNVLKTKAGSIASASFGGTPLSASVTFSTVFNNTNYSVAVTGEDARIFTVESKTAGGFVVNTNSNTALTGTTYWTCTAYGEN